MKIIEFNDQNEIAKYMIASDFKSFVIDFDFTITAYDSTKAANFWLYDIVDDCNRYLKSEPIIKKIFRIFSSKVVGSDMIDINDLHRVFSTLNDSEIKKCITLLCALPVNHHIIRSIKYLRERGANFQVISGGYYPIVKAVCEYYFGSIHVHAQLPGEDRIKGNKHRFVLNPAGESCLVTDNIEDLNSNYWNCILYYNFRKTLVE